MTSGINIKKFWLSFIWFETKLSFLKLEVPDVDTLPFSFLGRNQSYEKIFNRIIQNSHQITTLSLPEEKQVKLTLPWKTSNDSTQDFWYRYLGQDKDNVIARLAWERFVPLRGEWFYKMKASKDWTTPPEKIDLEAFYYPHGIGLILTVRCKFTDRCDLDEMVNQAFRIRKDGEFDLVNKIKGKMVPVTLGTYTLDSVARKALDFLRNQAWADNFPGLPSLYVGYPFSIFTVTRAEGLEEDKPLSLSDDILRNLYAVSEWSKLAQDVDPPLVEARLPVLKNASSNDILYGIGINGRAVWLPGTFLHANGEKILVAYHRNLALASLQVASLCSLVYEGNKLLQDDDSTPLTPYLGDCLRRAVHHLEHLYIGKDTYKTYSVRRQIEKNQDMLDALNYVRAYWNMSPLPTPRSSKTPSPTDKSSIPLLVKLQRSE